MALFRSFDRLWMPARLPESPGSVHGRVLSEGVGKTRGQMLTAIIAKLSAGELAKIGECSNEACVIEIGVKGDPVHVGRHDHIGIDPQVLLLITECQALRNSFERRLGGWTEVFAEIKNALRELVASRAGTSPSAAR